MTASSLSPFRDVFSNDGPRAAKPAFQCLPQKLHDDLCALAAAREIIGAREAQGGFSVSASWLLTFDTGRRLFVKGSHPQDMSHGAANLRAECDAYRSLDILREVSPAFCGMVCSDAQDDDGWWLGAWQALETMSPSAIDADDLFALLAQVQNSTVDPRAILPVALAHPYLSQFFNDTHKWQRLSKDPARAAQFDSCFADSAAAAGWRAENISSLLALQAGLSSLPFSIGLMHGDLRLDNFLYGAAPDLTPRWHIVDWANAAEGPLAFDRVMLAASLLAAGLGDTNRALVLARGQEDEKVLAGMLAGMSGYFADQMYRAVPPAMPRLRGLQKAMFWGCMQMLAGLKAVTPLPEIAP